MNGRPINMMRAETSDSALWRGELELQLQQTLTGEESAGCPGAPVLCVTHTESRAGCSPTRVESQTRSLVEPPTRHSRMILQKFKGCFGVELRKRVHQQPWAAPNNAAAGSAASPCALRHPAACFQQRSTMRQYAAGYALVMT